MKTKRALIFFAALLSVCFSFAQNPFELRPLNFKAAPQLHFITAITIPAQNFTFQAEEEHAPAAFDPEVHYPAFFCRMELKAVKHFGVWVKIHAGDYDRYSKGYR